MISLSVTIRPVESDYVLQLLGASLRRYWHLPAHDGHTIVHVPRMGAALMVEHPGRTVIEVVAADEAAAQLVAELVDAELVRAVPGCDYRRAFSVAWERSATIPALLR
jgi:hypothetical protein